MSQWDRAFEKLSASAINGERCPVNESVPGGSHAIGELAKAGKIYVEVFRHNFRRVTILVGTAKGKVTMAAPNYPGGAPARPYLTIDTSGTRRNGSIIDPGARARRQPSLQFANGRRIGESMED